MKDQDHLNELFEKYISNRHSKEELEELLVYFELGQSEDQLHSLILDELRKRESIQGKEEQILRIATKAENKIFEHTRPKTITRRLIPYISIAALVLATLLAGYFLMNRPFKNSTLDSAKNIDALPGSKRAILKLSDGEEIDLNKSKNGQIAIEYGQVISKSANGEIVYEDQNIPSAREQFNTIITPNGGEYQVRLPDGTKVWLNAASSLKYPVSFDGLKERRVELTGEAYFEVTHNKSLPFRVQTAGQTVEVLGTHFNINSYANEGQTLTTLAEGSVKVNVGARSVIIKPGEQANNRSNTVKVEPADLQVAMAWKNGNIIFKSMDLKAIMRQVERWYDVRVKFEGNIPGRLFSGGMPKDTKLSILLSVLKDSKINFKLEETPQGKLLTVQP